MFSVNNNKSLNINITKTISFWESLRIETFWILDLFFIFKPRRDGFLKVIHKRREIGLGVYFLIILYSQKNQQSR